jgi:hypothetical protein
VYEVDWVEREVEHEDMMHLRDVDASRRDI